MKLKIFSTVFIAILVSCLFSAFKGQDPGQVYFIRSTDNNGTLVPYKVFIDDQLVCHLKNKRYSQHSLSPGEHTVSIQNTGLASHTKSRPLKINVVAGKSNYLVAVNGSDLYLVGSVESYAKELLKKVVATKECLPAGKKK